VTLQYWHIAHWLFVKKRLNMKSFKGTKPSEGFLHLPDCVHELPSRPGTVWDRNEGVELN